MQLSTTQIYKHREIRHVLHICPICHLNDELEIKSSVTNGSTLRGVESIACGRCKLQLSFTFAMDSSSEIIDAYLLDFFKVGNLEFKNNNAQLALYHNNTYIRDIAANIVDLDKCQLWLMLS